MKAALLKDCDLLTPQVDRVIDTAKSALQGNQKARNDLPSQIADARNTNNRIDVRNFLFLVQNFFLFFVFFFDGVKFLNYKLQMQNF